MQPTSLARPTLLTRGLLWLHVYFFVFFALSESKHRNLHVDALGWGPKPWTQTPESHEHGRAGQHVLVASIVAQLELQLQGEPGHPQKPLGCLVIGFWLYSDLLVPLAAMQFPMTLLEQLYLSSSMPSTGRNLV